MDLAPFTRPLPGLCDDEDAWRGGARYTPTWSTGVMRGGVLGLDAASVHTLLRTACLPRAELAHMGATDYLLRGHARMLPAKECVRVFGRVVWDRIHGEQGAHYSAVRDGYAVLGLGRRVVEEWFDVC